MAWQSSLVVFILVVAIDLSHANHGYPSHAHMERFLSRDEAIRVMFESLMDRLERQEVAIRQLQTMVPETLKETRTKNQQIERLESFLCEVMDKLREKDGQVNRLENELQEIKTEFKAQRHDQVLPGKAVLKHMKSKGNLKIQQIGEPDDGTKEETSTKDDSKLKVDKRQLHTKQDVASVAFSVALQNNINVHEHETLAFGHVILDEGSGYNSGDGIYTVPQSGVYVFTWSITAGTHSGGHDVYTNLVVNGSPVGGIDSDSDASNSGSSTGVVVTYVDYGDHVFIRTGSSGSITSGQSAKSTFSGWLLF